MALLFWRNLSVIVSLRPFGVLNRNMHKGPSAAQEAKIAFGFRPAEEFRVRGQSAWPVAGSFRPLMP